MIIRPHVSGPAMPCFALFFSFARLKNKAGSVLEIFIIFKTHSGNPILDSGFWTLDSGFWTLDFGFWTLDSGQIYYLVLSSIQSLVSRV